MAEFRLNCPGCGAEYVVPQDAIPTAGREVECSRCERVWQAQRPKDPARPLDLADFTAHLPGEQAPPPLPPASKRLSPDILDILRDEVEYERSLRAAEEDPEAPRLTVPQAAMSDSDWPATTVTLPAQETDKPRDKPSATPTVIRHSPPRRQAPKPAPKPAPAPAPRPEPVAQKSDAEEARPAPLPPVPARRTTRGYGTGFAISMLATAALLALYVATPLMAAKGLPLSDQLSGFRAEVDQARQWLSATLIPR